MRIKPNSAQRKLLESHFGANRWLWNYFLEKRKREYQEHRKNSTYLRDAAELTKLKHDGEHEWLNDTSSVSLQRTLRHLDTAYNQFLKRLLRFPKFKSKKKNHKSFTLAGSIKIRGKRLVIPKFSEGLKFNRPLPTFAKINNVTISCSKSGKYYASLSVEAEVCDLPKTGSDVGIDLGLKCFAVRSDGSSLESTRPMKFYEQEMRKAQQHLSRKKVDSNRRQKQRAKVAKIHEKIANSRNDFLHKASIATIREYDTIYLESLVIRNLQKNTKLRRFIDDAGWYEFASKLDYKAKWYGKEVRKIGRFYPSSKTCAYCGFINQRLRLNEREWKCPQCERILDRDLNAAVNILAEGRRNFAPAMGENRRGDGVRPRQLTVEASV